MAFFLTNDQKKQALFHMMNAEDWFEAMKRECKKEPTSTIYLKEKARQIRYALDTVCNICELAERQEAEQ